MVAPGAVAPGHLGELTRVVPFELVDCLVDDARARERRLRLLPSRTGVYFLLAMCLFPRAGYLAVWGRLTAALDGLGLAAPSAKALRDLRRRIGTAPVRALFEVLAGPLGRPGTPGVMAGGYRTVSFDGCKTVKVPDTPANRGWLGKMNAALGVAGYPVIQFMALVETGTRALLGAAFGSTATSELDWARQLLHLLDESMLLLMDRGFDAGDFLAQVAGTGAQFLVRLNASRRPPVLRYLPDGSFTSVIGGVKVRVIAAEVTVSCHDGTSYGGWYRLATTLLDHQRAPAARLAALYHERWESENGYAELKTRLRGAAFILRSRSPELTRQELFAFLTVYQALCALETDAARQAGLDPDRISFTVTVRVARDHAASHAIITPRSLDLARRQAISDLLSDILPRRRDRHYERIRKQPKNNFPAMKQRQQRLPSRVSYKIKVTRKASSPAGTP